MKSRTCAPPRAPNRESLGGRRRRRQRVERRAFYGRGIRLCSGAAGRGEGCRHRNGTFSTDSGGGGGGCGSRGGGDGRRGLRHRRRPKERSSKLRERRQHTLCHATVSFREQQSVRPGRSAALDRAVHIMFRSRSWWYQGVGVGKKDGRKRKHVSNVYPGISYKYQTPHSLDSAVSYVSPAALCA